MSIKFTVQSTTTINAFLVVSALAISEIECEICGKLIHTDEELRMISIRDPEPGMYEPKMKMHPDCLEDLGIYLIKLS